MARCDRAVHTCVFQPFRPNGGRAFVYHFHIGGIDTETRVAVLAVIVSEGSRVQELNELLHQYGEYIIGRMGVPYRKRGVNVISVALDAPADTISALSGKIGRLDGITAKTVYAPEGSIRKEEEK